MLESYKMIADPNWRPEYLSTQQLVDCESDGKGCEGGNIQYGMMYAYDHDIVAETEYPYITAETGYCKYSGAPGVRNTYKHEWAEVVQYDID